MILTQVSPAPSPDEFARRLVNEASETLEAIRQHCIRSLDINNAGWSPLVGIVQRVMQERGISY